MTCPNCGCDRDDALIPVWEDKDRHEAGQYPKFVGCTNCHRMYRPDLLRGKDDEIPPQARLTDHETSRLPIGNQHSDDLSIIEWQCVKGAAIHYDVRDWTSKADSTLTAEENVSLMERYGSRNTETTMRGMQTLGEYSGEAHE